MLVSDWDTGLYNIVMAGLNPCFSGCWSRTYRLCEKGEIQDVLILVLVDVGLGRQHMLLTGAPGAVLILVLVDVGLGLPRQVGQRQLGWS